MKKKVKLITTGTILMLGLPTVVYGNTAEMSEKMNLAEITKKEEVQETSTFMLDPVIVTALRREAADLDNPASVTVLTAEDLKNTGAITVFDALERVVGMNSYSYGTGGEDRGGMNARVSLRGLDKGTLTMINGSPINLMNMNSTMSVIPLEAVERVEVVRGANSTLYGAEAAGGVINIITKSSKEEMNGYVSTQYGNYDSNYSVGIGAKRFFISFKREFKDEIDQYNPLFSVKTKKTSLGRGYRSSLFANWDITDKLKLGYLYSENDSNYKSWGYSKESQSWSNHLSTSTYNNRRQHAYLIYDDKELGLKSSLSYSTDRLRSGGAATSNRDANSLHLDTQKMWKFRGGKDHFILGGMYQKDRFEQLSGKTTGDFDRDQYAMYGTYSHQFSDKFTAILGVRGHFVPSNDYDDSQRIFLPQIQTVYKINPRMSWYTNIGKAFQMSSMSSPFYNQYVSRAGHLGPQTTWSYETGIKYAGKKDAFRFGLFTMRTDNKFKWVKENQVISGGDPNVSVQINSDEFRNTGVEMEYSRKIDRHWSLQTGLYVGNPKSKNKGEDWEQDEARVQYSLGATYKQKKFTANAQLFATTQRENSYYTKSGSTAKPETADHRIPNKVDLNITLQYDFNKYSTLTAGGYNLLDRENPINHSENWSTPRNYRLMYTLRF